MEGQILIVDDNDMNREICAISLENIGARMHFAENGEQGLLMAQSVMPDLILLDIMMPVMDGFEMLSALKSDAMLKDIPVLMLTAKCETETIVKALDNGANDYLKKPFEEEEMVARVKTLLKNRYLEKRVKEDLNSGAIMQQKFLMDLPSARSVMEPFAIAIEIFNRSYATVSGDFYQAGSSGPECCSFFFGDSCGHGLSAALISMRILGLLERLNSQCLAPSFILETLNDDIAELMPMANFVAATSLQFNQDGVTISNGAQPYPVLLSDGKIEEIIMEGFPLGLTNGRKFQEKKLPFNPGDRLLLYTDGISETVSKNEEIYGKERLLSHLISPAGNTSSEDLIAKIIDDIRAFSGNSLVEDDQTLIIFEKHIR